MDNTTTGFISAREWGSAPTVLGTSTVYGSTSISSNSIMNGTIAQQPIGPGMTLMDDHIKIYRNKIECGNSIIITPSLEGEKLFISDFEHPEIKYEMTEIIDVIKNYKSIVKNQNKIQQRLDALEERLECMPFPGCEIYEKAKDDFYRTVSS